MSRPDAVLDRTARIVLAGGLALAVVAVLAVGVLARDGEDPTATAPAVAPPPQSETGGSEPAEAQAGHDHGDPTVPVRALTAAEEQARADELAATTAAVPFATVAEALAGGYRITNTAEGADDVHLARREWIDDAFDPARPEQLLAASRDPEGEILAAVFWVETGPDAAPEGFRGPEDQWHRHDGQVCNGPDGVGLAVSSDECATVGGTLSTYGGWMLHAWVRPDHPNPDGVFAVASPCRPEPEDPRCG